MGRHQHPAERVRRQGRCSSGCATSTDGGVSEGGFFGDAITVTADGADRAHRRCRDRRRRLDPRAASAIVGATYTRQFDNYYIAGNRSYVSYDKYLKTGPYYFGYANTRPDYVDHYAYQEGLLISYWDTCGGGQRHVRAPG